MGAGEFYGFYLSPGQVWPQSPLGKAPGSRQASRQRRDLTGTPSLLIEDPYRSGTVVEEDFSKNTGE